MPQYRIVKINQLPNEDAEVHYERGASLAHLAALVFALQHNIADQEVLRDGIYFTPIADHRITNQHLKSHNELVIWRTRKFGEII